jgi:hypothetical protein
VNNATIVNIGYCTEDSADECCSVSRGRVERRKEKKE